MNACPRCDSPIKDRYTAFVMCERGHLSDRPRDEVAAAPMVLRAFAPRETGAGPACPKCRSPIVEMDNLSATCAMGHSVVRAAVALPESPHPAAPTVPQPPVAHPLPPPPPAPRRQYVAAVRLAAEITPTRVEWLWPGRIPRGKMVIIDGDPGLGKSLLTLDIAARLSTGRPMPGEAEASCPPEHVLLLNNEDSESDTVVPRLEAAEADLHKVHILTHVDELTSGDEESFAIPTHTEPLIAAIERFGVRLVVLDPLMSFLDAAVNTSKDHSVRRALNPIKEIAQRTGCTVLFVRHLNKAVGSSALYRGSGSTGFSAFARATLSVDPHPTDPTRRVLAPNKMNLAARSPALVYAVDSDPPRIEWHGTIDVTADDLLGSGAASTLGQMTDKGRAASWLRTRLGDGPREARALIEEGEREGFSPRTLRAARNQAGVTAVREGFGADGRWIWQLAGERATDQMTHEEAYEG